MAYTPHVLVAIGGSWVNDTNEVWECTVRLQANGGGGDTLDPDAYLAAIATPLKTWFTTVATHMSNAATLAWVKANHVGADGNYVDPTTTHVHDYSPVGVGGLGQYSPGFCSLAYTWETANARGPGHRGRIYPPNCTWVTDSSAFKVTAADATTNATNGAGLLAVLKNTASAPGLHGTPVVASKVNGAIIPITGCTSDNVYDVQNRRKNRIKGTRSAIVAFA